MLDGRPSWSALSQSRDGTGSGALRLDGIVEWREWYARRRQLQIDRGAKDGDLMGVWGPRRHTLQSKRH